MQKHCPAGIRRLKAFFVCLLFLASIIQIQPVYADVVTDTLSVCVGYFGMELDDYVTVGTYHWSELEQNLPITSAVYSYYSGGSFADEYTAVVDTANGFLLTDLLDYAKIYYNDVSSFLFYVEDTQGIWVSFDRDTLFADRYYFDNLPSHRVVLYATKTAQVQVGEEPVTEIREVVDEATGQPLLDEYGTPVTEEVIVGYQPIYEDQEVPDYTRITGYDFSNAWEAAESVEPMLALEDNWASFNETFESIGPDDTYMSTGNRFRLLFGQTHPTESMTHDSAKYVSRVYVTLNGAPQIGEMPESLDNTLGSHEFTMTVDNIYNEDMASALADYLNLSSTDESVLIIDEILYDETEYSDRVSITVKYSILSAGTASIGMNIGGKELFTETGEALSARTEVTVPSEAEPEPSPEPSLEPSPEPSPVPSSESSPIPYTPAVSPEPAPESSQPVYVPPSPSPSPSASAAPATPAVSPAATRTPQSNSVVPAVQSSPPAPQASAAPSTAASPTASPAASPAPSATVPTPSATPIPEDRSELECIDIAAAPLLPQERSESVQALSADTGNAGFALTGDAAALLDGSSPPNSGTLSEMPDQAVDQVLLADNSEEKEREQKKILLLTCIGLLFIGLLGAGSELLTFRVRSGTLHRRKKPAEAAQSPADHPNKFSE